MTKEQLQSLGISEDDILNRVVDRICESIIPSFDEAESEFGNRVEGAVKERIDKVMSDAFEKHVHPKITEMVENVTLQATNRWGEARGEKLTFIEYLTERADAYIREEVNHNGKTQSEDSYSWRKHGTRIAYLVNSHLQYSIQRAMEQALGDVNSSVRKGLEEAVKIALAGIKVSVNTTVKHD